MKKKSVISNHNYNPHSHRNENNSSLFFNPIIQPKLKINNPNDKFEQEADAVADKVMNMNTQSLQTKPDTNSFFKPLPTAITPIQRKCAHCENEEKMQRKEFNGEEKTADSNLENYVSGLSNGGQPLPNEARNFYEPRFGYDFGNVKIHTGTVAAKSAQSINALAYTSGNNIVFNNGQYAPNTDSGKKLLGHELTHVVQQNNNIQTYRINPVDDKSKDKKYSFNFGRSDSDKLIEDSFNKSTEKETKPWIELLTVDFTAKKDAADGVATWFGNASVKYYDNPVKWADFTFVITGGGSSSTKTDAGDFTVRRIEAIGYNSGTYSEKYDPKDREGPKKRYSKDLLANMSYAVFYNKGEALHEGPLDISSHGCVHVDWDNDTLMKQVNYHSVIDLTKVKVKYT